MSGLKIYKSYNFRDKDPIIDKLRTIVQDDGSSYREISDRSGVSSHTLWQWFDGPTRRPQFATVMAVTRSLGFDLQVVRVEKAAKGARVIILDPTKRRAAKAA